MQSRQFLTGVTVGIFLLAAGGTIPAWAIVSMESVHLEEPKEGFRGEVEFSASGASGNTDKSDAALGTRLTWHRERHTNVAVADYSYGRAEGATNTDRAFLHLRHIYQDTPGFAWEGFVQGQRDRFARLSLRRLVGGGVRLTLLPRTDRRASFLGLGAFYEEEDLSEKAGTTDPLTDESWRANIYWVLKYRLRDGVELVNSVYYQPDVSDTADYRVLDTAAVRFELTDTLAFRLSAALAHDSRPPQSVKQTDVIYRTGLSWAF